MSMKPLILVAFLVTGCTSIINEQSDEISNMSRDAERPALGWLTGTSWALADSPDDPLLLEGPELTLTFRASDKIAGWAGCNAFSASIEELGPGSVRIGAILRTKRGCRFGRIEDSYLDALRHVYAYIVQGDGLTLLWQEDEQSGVLFFLRHTDTQSRR